MDDLAELIAESDVWDSIGWRMTGQIYEGLTQIVPVRSGRLKRSIRAVRNTEHSYSVKIMAPYTSFVNERHRFIERVTDPRTLVDLTVYAIEHDKYMLADEIKRAF